MFLRENLKKKNWERERERAIIFGKLTIAWPDPNHYYTGPGNLRTAFSFFFLKKKKTKEKKKKSQKQSKINTDPHPLTHISKTQNNSLEILEKMAVMEKLRMFVAQEPVVAASCLMGAFGIQSLNALLNFCSINCYLSVNRLIRWANIS